MDCRLILNQHLEQIKKLNHDGAKTPSIYMSQYYRKRADEEKLLKDKPKARKYQRDALSFIQKIIPYSGRRIQVDRIALRKTIAEKIDSADLTVICYDITQQRKKDGYSDEVRLDGENYRVQIINLIQYLDKRQHLHYLIDEIRRVRPDSI